MNNSKACEILTGKQIKYIDLGSKYVTIEFTDNSKLELKAIWDHTDDVGYYGQHPFPAINWSYKQ